ncbi:Proteasome assembly chaperone 2 [Bagarius yarrelli]|uniref:Proteasome assembly chaperone 2 n=1 Tax=Bagarius yarrelli TaxID=175774 RepID=A0A556V5B6_BAGYA|nr:Proteasome assembly chaperone 2 [Bagarius yarrelli]
MPRVGHFHTDFYCRADLRLAVLQIRSPVLPTKLRCFRKLLLSWMKTSGFWRTVLLSSCHAHHRDDQQLLSCSENISMAVLLLFCSEGDNVPDAFTLVNHLNDWLRLLDTAVQDSVPWRIPSSWRLLFGSGVPPMIF